MKTFQPFKLLTIQHIKAVAFTLAETLIVIGIIGVVAALTLPNLNHATGDKEKVTKVKKIYSALTDAFDRAQVVYGDFDTWFVDIDDDILACNERFGKRVTEFMKVSKDCGFSSGCWSDTELIDAAGESIGDSGYIGYSVILSDGVSITFSRVDSNKSQIKVDIDGPNNGKKQVGNDIFDFSIYTKDEYAINDCGANVNQLYPSAQPSSWTGNINIESYHGNYATAWVIQNNNLDYLKCYDELNWETQTSCK